MGILITSVGSSVSFAPALELPKTQAKAAGQRAAMEQLAASLPGSSGQTEISSRGNAINKKLQFVVDHRSNEVRIKVIDRETDKVIKVLPPEELQRLHTNLREAIGLLFDEMA
jgi:flagellar protein FlaG